MSQYEDRVNKQRIKLKAEEWAKGVKAIHAHSMDSMHYDTRPEDTAKGSRNVLDVEYNDSSVRRTLDTNEVVMFGHALSGKDLIDAFSRSDD